MVMVDLSQLMILCDFGYYHIAEVGNQNTRVQVLFNSGQKEPNWSRSDNLGYKHSHASEALVGEQGRK